MYLCGGCKCPLPQPSPFYLYHAILHKLSCRIELLRSHIHFMQLEGYNDYGTSGTFSLVFGVSDISLNQLGFAIFKHSRPLFFHPALAVVVGMIATLCRYLCETGKSEEVGNMLKLLDKMTMFLLDGYKARLRKIINKKMYIQYRA